MSDSGETLEFDIPGSEPGPVRPKNLATALPIGTLRRFIDGETSQAHASMDHQDNETFIPVHGFVELNDAEMEIVGHAAFQRLGMIYQLGQTHLVYRGATHRRFEHVLGTLFVAQRMIDSVHRNHRQAQRKEATAASGPFAPLALGASPTPIETTFVRLAALLHDIGHLPAGHTLEDELGFLDKHDKHARLNKVLNRTQWPGGEVESLRTVIDREYGKWLDQHEISASELLIQIVAKDPPVAQRTVAEKLVRVDVCRDIVGNTICADLLDYLHRDWYHIGKPQYFDQRIFQYMEIREDRDGVQKFIINLGSRPKLRTDAVTAILRLLETRYELAESVLFHRTKCTAAAMLERALYEMETRVPNDDRADWKARLEEKFLDQSDESAIDELLAEASRLNCEPATRSLRALRRRRLYKGIETIFFDQLSAEHLERLTRLYTGSPESARKRNSAMRVLEKDFGLPPGSLVIYSPDKGMNAKVAEVKIHVNGHIGVFKELDEKEQILSGGHIGAQLRRFSRLWRIHVGVDREVWRNLSEPLRQALIEAINTCVLGLLSPGRTYESAVRAIAAQLSVASDGPFHGRLVEARAVAALGGNPDAAYPTSAPAIRSFFAEVQ